MIQYGTFGHVQQSTTNEWRAHSTKTHNKSVHLIWLIDHHYKVNSHMVLTISHEQCESNDDNPRSIEQTIWIIAYRAIAFFVLCVICATIWIPLYVRIKDEKQKDNQRGVNIITGFLYYIYYELDNMAFVLGVYVCVCVKVHLARWCDVRCAIQKTQVRNEFIKRKTRRKLKMKMNVYWLETESFSVSSFRIEKGNCHRVVWLHAVRNVTNQVIKLKRKIL